MSHIKKSSPAPLKTSSLVKQVPTVQCTSTAGTNLPMDQFWRPNKSRATDLDHPNGSGNEYPYNKMTVLEQHIKFWDLNNDGWITPLETFIGFRQLGFNLFVAIGAVLFINGTFSYATQDGWIPDPFFRIKVKNSQKARHGSDTGVLDEQGYFIPSRFEELFHTYARSSSTHMTLREAINMTEHLRVGYDFYGWFAAKLEWTVLFLLVGKRDVETGDLVLSKEDIRSQYDGTLFYHIRQALMNAIKHDKEYMPATLTAMSTDTVDFSYTKNPVKQTSLVA